MVKVLHERWKCIACAACAAVAPDFWEMDEQDNFADLKGAERSQTVNGLEERRTFSKLSSDQKQNLKESEQMCPVECIHVNED